MKLHVGGVGACAWLKLAVARAQISSLAEPCRALQSLAEPCRALQSLAEPCRALQSGIEVKVIHGEFLLRIMISNVNSFLL